MTTPVQVVKSGSDVVKLNSAKTHVAIILDRSGSMVTFGNEVVDGFNKQVKAIRQNKTTGQTTVCLIEFNDHV